MTLTTQRVYLHVPTGVMRCYPAVAAPRRPARPTGQPTPEGLLRSHHVSVARARSRTDKYVFQYELRYLTTFTWAREPSRPEWSSHVSHLTRRLRRLGFTVRLLVPELSDDGREHLHLATAAYLPAELAQAIWPYGGTTPPDVRIADGPEGLKAISVYLTESFDTSPKGRRRFIIARGMRIQEDCFTAASIEAAVRIVTRRLGVEPKLTGWYACGFMAFFPDSAARRDKGLPA